MFKSIYTLHSALLAANHRKVRYTKVSTKRKYCLKFSSSQPSLQLIQAELSLPKQNHQDNWS